MRNLTNSIYTHSHQHPHTKSMILKCTEVIETAHIMHIPIKLRS